jgi:ABC-type uncharacterized transport system permease subunit
MSRTRTGSPLRAIDDDANAPGATEVNVNEVCVAGLTAAGCAELLASVFITRR